MPLLPAGIGDDARSDRWQRLVPPLAVMALAVFVVERTASVILPFLGKVAGILQPVVVALAIAYLLDPLVNALQRRGLKRTAGVGLIALALVLAFVLVAVVIVPTVVEQAQDMGPRLAAYFDAAVASVRERLGDRLPGGLEKLRAWGVDGLQRADWAAVLRPVTEWLGGVAYGGFAALGWLLNIVLVPVLAAYLLVDMPALRDGVVGLIPPARRERLLTPAREIDDVLSRFVRGQLTVAACLAALYMTGLAISGTPLGLTIGLFAGMVSFIPYLGIIMGLVPALVLTAVEHGLTWHLAGVVSTFVIAQLLEGWVITPKIVGGSVGLHPVVIILAVVAGGSFFGVTGMLLAVPAAAAAMVFVRRAAARYRGSSWYGAKQAPGPEPAQPEPS